MYGYGYPSPTSSGLPVTPPGNSRSPPTNGAPGAPYLYPQHLPPSPELPTIGLPHHHGSHTPIAPRLSYVPLPAMAGAPAPHIYGLMTPPTSPTKNRSLHGGSFNLHPCLTEAGATRVHYHFGRGLQSIMFQGVPNPQTILCQSATDTNLTTLTIRLSSGFEIHITNPNGVQVGDVFHQLHLELNRRLSAREMPGAFGGSSQGAAQIVRMLDSIVATPYFAGLTLRGNSWLLQLR